jgi:hypothetical protein
MPARSRPPVPRKNSESNSNSDDDGDDYDTYEEEQGATQQEQQEDSEQEEGEEAYQPSDNDDDDDDDHEESANDDEYSNQEEDRKKPASKKAKPAAKSKKVKVMSEEFELEETQSSTTITTKPKPPPRKSKKRKLKFDATAAVHESVGPSHERKTDKGGYAHTNRSRLAISKANTGNTPWNKGRNRSSADKAKIAAGVRARNRTVLLEKLKRLGLSEEEYARKRKEIKYLRERVRRAKVANAQYKASTDDAAKQLQEALEATTDKVKTNPQWN